MDGRRAREGSIHKRFSLKRLSAATIMQTPSALSIPGEVDDTSTWETLRDQLYEAHARCVTLEAEIREEVGMEMAQRLEQMEEVFRKRVETAAQISDRKSETMVMNLRKRMKQDGKNVYTLEDIQELVQNITECEEEMERMRTLHAMDVDMLKKELRAT